MPPKKVNSCKKYLEKSGFTVSGNFSKKKSRKARLAEKKKLRGKDARRRESDDEDDDGAPYGENRFDGQSSKTSQEKVDVADDRFAGLFESEKFALDPTDPRFRETKAAGFIAEERARRRSEKSSASHSAASTYITAGAHGSAQ